MRFPVRSSLVRSLRRCPPAIAKPVVPTFMESTSGVTPLQTVVETRPDVPSKNDRRIKSPLWRWATTKKITKKYVDGKIHMTAVNYNTEVKSIVKLSLPPKVIQNARVTKLSQLPSEAMEALGAIIMGCKKTPKMLQNEADGLSDKLESRHFPASPEEVRIARSQILDEIFTEDPSFSYHWRDTKQRPLLRKVLQNQVEQRLAMTRYNWRPIQFKNKEAAAIYALSRFGGYFAEMHRVLAEFDRNGFMPETVLDYGSGLGAAFWAAFKRWGDSVREYSLMDKDEVIRHFSMDLLRGSNYNGSGEMITQNVFFRKDLFPSPKHTYDLVILHRTLIELPSQEERLALIEKLWQRTKKFLVVVDSPMPDAFKALIQVRDFILIAGTDFDPDKTKELLRRHGKLNQDIIELFANNKVENYEKYCVARELLPEEIQIPTRLDPGHVFAPCPHDQGCPLLSRGRKHEACKFKLRWQEYRADHRTRSENRDGTLTGEFSFIIMEKGERKAESNAHSRILQLNRAHKCVSCRLCTPFDGVQLLVVPKVAKKIYARVRRAMPSQLLPVNLEVVKNEIELLRIDRTNANIDDDDKHGKYVNLIESGN